MSAVVMPGPVCGRLKNRRVSQVSCVDSNESRQATQRMTSERTAETSDGFRRSHVGGPARGCATATEQHSVLSDLSDYKTRVAEIESSNNPLEVTGSNKGLYQFGPEEMEKYGITDWRDVAQQNTALQLETEENYARLSSALGRSPTEGELYLAHQQGPSGAPALLTAPADTPAWQAIRQYGLAKRAIRGNIPGTEPLSSVPVEQISAGAFRNMWINRFESGTSAA